MNPETITVTIPLDAWHVTRYALNSYLRECEGHAAIVERATGAGDFLAKEIENTKVALTIFGAA